MKESTITNVFVATDHGPGLDSDAALATGPALPASAIVRDPDGFELEQLSVAVRMHTRAR